MGLSSSPIVAFAATRDRVRARAFYLEALGLPLQYEDDFAIVFNAHGTTLRVTPVQEMVAAGYTVLGWSVTDIAAMAKELSARGVRFERFPGLAQDEAGVWQAPGGARVAWFRDPDGNVLSISQLPNTANE
jgi:catechol 2,3-dioxygenase-like lactoylglutathione lyase family enzyme